MVHFLIESIIIIIIGDNTPPQRETKQHADDFVRSNNVFVLDFLYHITFRPNFEEIFTIDDEDHDDPTTEGWLSK